MSSGDLWPDDIKSQTVRSPQSVLEEQAVALKRRTNGLLLGEVRRNEISDEEDEVVRIVLGFEIYAPELDKRVNLFEVIHGPNFEYPAAFVPPDDNTPDYLREKYYQPGEKDAMKAMRAVHTFADEILKGEGRWVENEWVAKTPLVFSEKLRVILAMPVVTGVVLSLIGKSNQKKERASA